MTEKQEKITSFKSQGITNIPEIKLVKIQGKLTSQVRQRSEKDPYYYAFIKLKGHGADLPVIFRIKEENKLALKKGDLVELSGNYSNSNKNIRKSFTCFSYNLVDK
ncbi:MAG: hypothetical protein mread185_000184 [Mycoplasmataceae bacterium]|nr:MAG: hypothetical protein mread185_000184 [Mycoplasmataceae bacterium]